MKGRSIPEELRFLNAWVGDMIRALQNNPEILNPLNQTPCIHELFRTECQKSYTGLHDALCSLPQSCSPLVVWFLVVFVKQMKIQHRKDSEVVLKEEAEMEKITGGSTVSYSILAQYENYVFAAINFEDVQFIWPSRQKPKGKSKGEEDLVTKICRLCCGEFGAD